MSAVDVIDAAINKVRQHAWPQTMDLEEARAAVAELIEAANRMTDFADDEYVPNTVFARLTQAIRRCGAAP